MGERTLLELMEMTEDAARRYLEQVRWPDGPVCVHCGDVSVTRLEGEAHRAGVFKCRGCREQFTVTVGTIFESSHIPLKKWLVAFHLVCSSKKGISAKQLQRNLGLKSYESAWHMAHRIRHAMSADPVGSKLSGTVEVDETYVGGKPRNPGPHNKRGAGTKKTPVLALVERGGDVRAWPIERVTVDTLQTAVKEHVDQGARVMTDESFAYQGLDEHFEGGHHTVKHTAKEYARGDVTTNAVEGFFSLLKRGVYGTFHSVSKKHLHRYLAEFTFRYNARKISDETRTTLALRKAEGKRLRYRKAA